MIGTIVAVAVAVGIGGAIAIGLGGKDSVAKYLEKRLENRLHERFFHEITRPRTVGFRFAA